MASCDSIRQIFESPLPENPSLVDSLATWNHIKPRERVELSSFSEIFGELHFKETLGSSSSLPFLTSFQTPSPLMTPGNHETNKNPLPEPLKNQERSSEVKSAFSLPSMNSESLNMCTEGLGFESFEDLEDGSVNEKVDDTKKQKEKTRHLPSAYSYSESRRGRTFPPPIPSIGRNGKPWVSYKSFRSDGRLVLKEIMTSTHGQEFMHACREDGRLTLHLIHRDGESHQDEERAQNEERETKDGTAEEDRDEIEQNSKC